MAKLKENSTILKSTGEEIIATEESVDRKLLLKADKADLDTRMPKTGGTFTGIVTAHNNTSYTTKQIRNIILSTANPSGGANGDVWLKYKP